MKPAWLLAVVLMCAVARGEDIAPSEIEAGIREALAHVGAERALVPGSVRMPSIVMRTPGQLFVERIAISTSGHVDARIRCRPARACLPFVASAQLLWNAPAQVWAASGNRQGSKRPALKRGARVVFVREVSGGTLRVRAIALDAGNVGEMVRVRAIDGRQEVMRGRLGGDGVVRGES
jgi:hypothetical protein